MIDTSLYYYYWYYCLPRWHTEETFAAYPRVPICLIYFIIVYSFGASFNLFQLGWWSSRSSELRRSNDQTQ